MSDFLSDGYSLTDYASEGQLFYKPTDKIRFEGALNALCENDRHVVIVTDDKALAERYYRYFITRIAIRNNIILDTRAPIGADDVLNRFNKILSSSTVESARSSDNNDIRHVMAMIDTSNMSDHEWSVLGRLLKNFPGANIRMLAFVSESQLDVIDSVLDKLDGQVYRWVLTTPTPEYLEALLEMGEQYNYQSETIQMAAAMNYHRRNELPKDDLADELDALDAHLELLQNNKPSSSNGDRQPTAGTDNDFDADLSALLGAIKQSHVIDDAQVMPSTEPLNTSQTARSKPEPNTATVESRAKTPSRRLIWAIGTTGVILILAALFAPWEHTQKSEPKIQISARTFSTKATQGTTAQPSASEALGVQKSGMQSIETPTSLTATPENGTELPSRSVPALDELTESDPIKEASSSSPQWNEDMARILASETDNTRRTEALAPNNTRTNSETAYETVPEASDELVSTETIQDALNPGIANLEAAMTSDSDSASSNPMSDQITIDTPSDDTVPVLQEPEQEQAQAEAEAQGPGKTNDANPAAKILAAPNSSYFVQLGVYANPAQAQLLLDTLPPAAQAFQLVMNKSGRRLSTVLCGPYESKVMAEATAASTLNNFAVWIRTAKAVQRELAE